MITTYTVYSGINGDFDDFKTIEEAHELIMECIRDANEIHPDAESVILYKKIGHVVIDESDSNNCKIILPQDQETSSLRKELYEANERYDDLLTALTHDAENIADSVEEILDEYMVNVNDSDNITERLTQIINEIQLLSVKEKGGGDA